MRCYEVLHGHDFQKCRHASFAFLQWQYFISENAHRVEPVAITVKVTILESSIMTPEYSSALAVFVTM